VHSPAAAYSLVNDETILVGLFVFPGTRDPDFHLLALRIVAALPRVKWIGAIARELLGDELVRRIIAEKLYDFQVLPLHGERLAMALGHAYGMATIEREFRRTEGTHLPVRMGIVGDSPVMLELFRVLQHAAESDVPVLITGPTGTGKELAAKAIHDHSARARGPFVALNCAAIPPSLLQAELFGYVKGAFTDAVEGKIGHIEAASGGTLFLDEIGDMPIESQATLLRFLEDKIVTPLGSTRSREVDVRVVVSTNKDLDAAIGNGGFRPDLFYRLAVLIVRTPSLSSREGDVELLANHFLHEAIVALGEGRDLCFAREALTAMDHYAWPGNVRELRSCVFQAVISCQGRYILADDLKLGAAHLGSKGRMEDTRETMESARNQFEKRRLERSLALNGTNVTRAANDLGISRMTLYRLMAKHSLTRDRSS
jgi:DNA-binding NtrC family response regulator